VILDELRYPIVAAPMAGGPSTPALAAAVSAAGGLGFLAGAYRAAEALQEDIAEVRARTSAPFGVNLFALRSFEVDDRSVRSYIETLEPEAARYGAELGEPRFDDDGWEAKLALLHEERVPVVSFTFSCPDADVIAALKEAGSEIWVTVTRASEADTARAAGASALVVQGVEAGGHQGYFVDRDDVEAFGLLALLRLIAAEVDLPLVAAGGIADGAAVAAVLAAGAAAAQLGTAFMLADEAGTSPAHRAALATDTPTALTRAFSGRTARGLVNRFVREHSSDAPVAFPHLHHVTASLRAAAREQGDADGYNLFAGQAHSLAAALPAAEIVEALARDAHAALADAAARLR
jgi:nitronate monooxygenase